MLTRLYIRKWVLYNPGLDDWLIAVSMVFYRVLSPIDRHSYTNEYFKRSSVFCSAR